MAAFLKKHWGWGVIGLLALVFAVLISYFFWWGVTRLPFGERAPEFTLTNTQSQTVTLPSLDGKIKVMTFVFANCGDACPITLHYMMEVQDELKKAGLFGNKVVLLSVTMDPENDSEQVLAEYAEKFYADPAGWMFLRGSREETDRLMNALKVPAEKQADGQYMHSNRVFLIDDKRNMRTTYDLSKGDADSLLSDLKMLAKE